MCKPQCCHADFCTKSGKALDCEAVSDVQFLSMPATKRVVLKVILALVLVLAVVYVVTEDSGEKKVTVCKLFRVEMDDVAEASWAVLDKLTGEDVQKSRSIPRQDAEYCIEGAFRLAPEALPGKGIPANPQGYETYTGETVSDWMSSEEIRLLLWRTKRSGEVVFSPSTGWVYFKLDLQN